MKMQNMSENEVSNSILQFLLFKRITAWRNNNGAVADSKVNGGFRRKNKWETIHGSPVDILGVLPCGKFLAIEVKKDEKGKARKGQEKFMKAINDSGGIAFMAYSIDCVKENLDGLI